jgi:outer membrane protein OmpA-like peptidoglycan-associated protein
VAPPVIDDLAIGDDLTERLELQPLRFLTSLREPELSEVERVRLFLLANPTVELDIRVHLASFGPGTTAENDLHLTVGPARQIFLHLSNHGIDESRIRATGLGRSELVVVPANPDEGQTREERDANNRVEFLVTAL